MIDYIDDSINCVTQHLCLINLTRYILVGIECSKNYFLSPYAVFMNAAIPIAAVLAVRRLYSFDSPLNMYSVNLIYVIHTLISCLLDVCDASLPL